MRIEPIKYYLYSPSRDLTVRINLNHDDNIVISYDFLNSISLSFNIDNDKQTVW